MYIPDLHITDSGRVAIGWLDLDHPFPQRKPDPTFLAKLKDFARRYAASANALKWGAKGGAHSCDFCNNALGFGSFGVPAGDTLYHAPDLIAHYVDHHDYDPPAEFVSALMASPLPGTREYARLVKRFRAW